MQASNRPLLIGITGNIGSGKSDFCKYLRDSGCLVVSADRIANQHLEDPAILSKLVNRWGDDILEDGIVCHTKIAAIVFSLPSEREFLNSILHPIVLKDFQEIVDTSSEEAVFFEVPLLFEANLGLCFDFICLVHVPLDIRIERLQKRNSGDLEDIQKRIQSQIPDEKKFPLVDLVIDNSQSKIDLEVAARKLCCSTHSIPRREVKPFI